MSDWTFFSNHGHVLACLVQDNEARLRDVAERVGITERAVQKIVRDMQDAGILTVSKHGRRNRYRVNGRKALRHGLESHRRVSDLVSLMKKPAEAKSESTPLAEADPEAPASDFPEVVDPVPVPSLTPEPVDEDVTFVTDTAEEAEEPEPEPQPEPQPLPEPEPQPEPEPLPEPEPEPEPEPQPEPEPEPELDPKATRPADDTSGGQGSLF